MWTATHSKVVKSVRKEAIWERWSDVNTWHEWIPNIEYCKLDKPFVSGSRFILKPKGGSAVTVELVEVKKDHRFTGCTRFFGATMYDIHEMHQDPQGLRLTVTLKVTGPLGFLWRKLVGEKIESNLPKLIDNLVTVANASALKKEIIEAKSSILTTKKPNLHLVTTLSQSDKPKATHSGTKKTKSRVSLIKKTRLSSAAAKKAKSKSPLSVSTLKRSELSTSMFTATKPKSTVSATKKAKPKAKPKSKAKTKLKTVASKAPKKTTSAAKKTKPKTKSAASKSAASKTVKKKTSTVKRAKPKTKSAASKTVKKKTSAVKKSTAVKKAKPKAKSSASKPKPKAKSKASSAKKAK